MNSAARHGCPLAFLLLGVVATACPSRNTVNHDVMLESASVDSYQDIVIAADHIDAAADDRAPLVRPQRGTADRIYCGGGGEPFTCVLHTTGEVSCWGHNRWSKLGDGTDVDRRWPAIVRLPAPVLELSLGGSSACARLANEEVWCWGPIVCYMPGHPCLRGPPYPPPIRVADLGPVRSLAVSEATLCGATPEGRVICWAGDPISSRIIPRQEVPVLIPGLDNVVGISLGLWSACGWRTGGDAFCWEGADLLNVEGDGGALRPPIALTGVPPVRDVRVGAPHRCAITTDGDVWCAGPERWGWPFFLPGEDGGTRSWPVRRMPGLSGVASLRLSRHTACVILADQTVRCWGSNESGQLGRGVDRSQLSESLVPESPRGLGRVRDICAPDFHSCAITEDRTVLCWGYPGFHEADVLEPTVVPEL